MKTLQNHPLPRSVRDLLASPPRRGDGLNSWLYRARASAASLPLGGRDRAFTGGRANGEARKARRSRMRGCE
ncbi:MAG: hypothetical protein DME69_14495 [Verrucomicrobia bacterium]|nr:MAG: hypothetical protein DME69_14495 [Verrucomicrobiota bacterium]